MKSHVIDPEDMSGQQFVDHFAMMLTALIAHTDELQHPPSCSCCEGSRREITSEEAKRLNDFAMYVAAATATVLHHMKVVGVVVQPAVEVCEAAARVWTH